jgi:hypothetical protein
MKRDVNFYSAPGSPRWTIKIGEKILTGFGNPLTDETYYSILSKELTFPEGLELEEIMERPQFKTKKPVMMIMQPDRLFVLKPSYAERQEAIGMVLQFLADRAEAGLIGDVLESD